MKRILYAAMVFSLLWLANGCTDNKELKIYGGDALYIDCNYQEGKSIVVSLPIVSNQAINDFSIPTSGNDCLSNYITFKYRELEFSLKYKKMYYYYVSLEIMGITNAESLPHLRIEQFLLSINNKEIVYRPLQFLLTINHEVRNDFVFYSIPLAIPYGNNLYYAIELSSPSNLQILDFILPDILERVSINDETNYLGTIIEMNQTYHFTIKFLKHSSIDLPYICSYLSIQLKYQSNEAIYEMPLYYFRLDKSFGHAAERMHIQTILGEI